MAQIAEINAHLADPRARRVTAGELGLDPRQVAQDGTVVCAWIQGSPEFPYIFADVTGASSVAHVPLHTPALVRLSHLLGLRHHWGV